MRMYKCYVCNGLCDPGELEGGVCFECRQENTERKLQLQAQKSLDIRKEWNSSCSGHISSSLMARWQ